MTALWLSRMNRAENDLSDKDACARFELTLSPA